MKNITNLPNSSPVQNAALLLEGGGMRGIYTTGILDRFMDESLYFDYIMGVSAGATHALSYISRQKGRARRVNVDYCRRIDYMGLWCLLTEGSLFGMNLLFKKIPYKLDLFDFDSYECHVGRYHAVLTNVETGASEYHCPKDRSCLLSVAQATCSLPLVSRPVMIDGVPYLDGGISDSLPIEKMLSDGMTRIVCVLTQPAGYRKPISGVSSFFRLVYRRYPALIQAMERRSEQYNDSLAKIERLEREGSILVLRPSPQKGLRRLERNPVVLNGLYRSGYCDADERMDDILRFCALRP